MSSEVEIDRVAKLLWDARDKFCVDEMGHRPTDWRTINDWLRSKYRAMAKAVISDRKSIR